MRVGRLFLGVYWWEEQPKSLGACVRQLLPFLLRLKKHKPQYFSPLYGRGRSKKEALSKKVSGSYTALRKQFYSRQLKDSAYSDAGFSVGFWDGKEGEESLSISCLQGLQAADLPNHCLIELPSSGPMHAYYQQPTHLSTLLRIMITYWQPEFIRVNDHLEDLYPPFKEESGIFKLLLNPLEKTI